MAARTGWKSLWSLTLAGAALAGSLYALAPQAALAHDDGEEDIFSSLLGAVVGFGSDKTPDGEIDYRERAPLVVPPSMDLPPPEASPVASNPAWPKDPDVVRRARAAALARQVGPDPANPQIVTPLTQQELAANHDPRTDASVASGPVGSQLSTPNAMCADPMNGGTCSPQQLWGMLSAKSSQKVEEPALVPGVEPTRSYLTDPTPGYRIATKAVKAKPAAPEKADPASDPTAYYRDQALRDQSRDGLDDNQ